MLAFITFVVAEVAALSTGAAIFFWVWAWGDHWQNPKANWGIHWSLVSALIADTLLLMLLAVHLGPWK